MQNKGHPLPDIAAPTSYAAPTLYVIRIQLPCICCTRHRCSYVVRHTLYVIRCTSCVLSCRAFAAPDIAAPTLYVIHCTSYVVRHAYSIAVHLQHQTSLLLRCTSYVVRHAYSVAVHLQHLRSWLTRRLCKCHSLTYLNCNESFSQTKSCCSSNLCRMHTQGHWQMCAVAYI